MNEAIHKSESVGARRPRYDRRWDRAARASVLTVILALVSVAANAEQPATVDSADDATATQQPKKEMPSLIQKLPDYSGSLWSREYLTGDWGGSRTQLAEDGISSKLDLTQIIQGNAHGGKDTNNAFRYSGSMDLELSFDTARMNLWPGGLFVLKGETQFGQSINPKVGALMQPNTDALFPVANDPGATTLSEFFYVQALSEQVILTVGKVDATRIADVNAFANSEKTQFLNLGLRNNPVLLPFAPYTVMAAAVTVLPTDWLSVTSAVADTNTAANYTGFDTAFHSPEGMTLAQEWDFTVKPFGLTGHQRVGFAYSTKDMLALDSDGRIGLPRTLLRRRLLLGHPVLRLLRLSRWSGVDRRPDDWCLFYNFDQYVYTEKDDPTQGIGVFGRFGWSTGRANPTEAFYSIGLSGTGLVPTRDRDVVGLGYYYQDLSDRLRQFGLYSEQGVELFYNIEVTPWLHVTPDLQVVINPAGGFGDRDVAIVGGLRAQMSF